MSLRKQLREAHLEIKHHTLQNLIRGLPFRYMQLLAHYGYQDYKIPSKLSFEYGLNKSLDYYNQSNKDFTSKFYALKRGADAVIEYCWNNYKEYNK